MIVRALARFIRRSPWSTLMAVMGVVLGVSSIVAVHLVSAAVADQLDELLPGPIRGLDVAFTKPEQRVVASDYFALRSAWRGGEFSDVASLWPVIDENITVGGQSLRLIGVDVLARVETLPELDSSESEGLGLGGVLWAPEELHAVLRTHPLLREADMRGGLQAEDTVLMDIGLAQEIIGWAEEDIISYAAAELVNPFYESYRWLDEIAPGFSAGLPEIPPPNLEGWQTKSMGELQPANRFGRSVLFNIGALGLLALVVAWFLIYQVAVAWLRRLWQIFERLHVLGVTYGELRVYFMSLLAVLGLVNGSLGLYLGNVLATTLVELSIGVGPSMSVTGWLVVKAMGSAVGVCLLGGYWAYSSNLREARGPRLWVILFAIVGIATGVLLEVTGLFGAFFAIACSCILALSLLVPALTTLRRTSNSMFGHLLLRMSLREVVWFPRDLWVALGGLVMAVATAIGVSLMIASFRVEFADMLDQRLSYDYSVEGNAVALIELEEHLKDQKGIDWMQLYFEENARIDGQRVQIDYARFDDFEARRYGLDRALRVDEVLVSEQAARLLAVGPMDSLEVGDRTYQVVRVFKSFGDLLPRVLLDQAVKPSRLQPISLSIQASEDLDRGAFGGDLRWQDQGTIKALALETFDRTFAITSVLIVIAVMVAGIGIYVATTVLRLNQQASARLLVSMGVTRGETWQIDIARGVGIGALACLVALPLGYQIGWLLCDVVNPRAFGWTVTLRLIPDAVLVPMFWGMVAAVAAAIVRVGINEQGRFDAVAR